ncbi:MAG TPA: acetate/propionate family kinase, partial [Spirochaetia bacterium]|nr:acetate/propionate family kinase [Spirochaetia bacterium]
MNSQNDTRKILVINCGSSSLKYEVYSMPQRMSLGKGLVERIGEEQGRIVQESPKGKFELTQHLKDHRDAMQLMSKALTDSSHGFLKSMDEISGAGHRVVHGGEQYSASVIIDDAVIKSIDAISELAPLHNPPNLVGIKQAQAILPGREHVAVFDTAFHQTLPPAAYLYGLPREFYEKYRIRRYGFHGTSHRYVATEALKLMKRSPENTNVISCHLGNGASITAIQNGISIDTSMGFTPLEGLVMG